MGLVFQVLIIVALLFCDSHQLGRKGDASISVHRSAGLRSVHSGNNGYNSGMGPYDCEVKLFRQCDDRGLNLVNLNLEAYNTKTDNGSKILYRGNFTTPFTIEQFKTQRIKIEVYRQKDKKEFMMLDYDENICKAATGPGKDVFDKAKKVFNVEVEDPCLIPEGFYSFKDWEITGKLPPPVMEYGDYRATIELFYDQQKFVCLEVFVLVKQKM